MDEYIKKTDALKIIDEVHGRRSAYHRVHNIPAEDVSPVRHAKWEVVVGSDGKEKMVCTGCRKQQDLTGVFSYCPNCGAKMDGDDNG